MKLEDQVCSLELAKRLKELGVKQESVHDWFRSAPDKPYVLDGGPVFKSADPAPWFAAFTVAELGEMLTCCTYSWRWNGPECCVHCANKGGGFTTKFKDHEEMAKTEADARAKMLIHLLENKLVKP